MNGPDHYREGDRLLAWCEDQPTDEIRPALTAAQAHYTAALAAATAQAGARLFASPTATEWREVIS